MEFVAHKPAFSAATDKSCRPCTVHIAFMKARVASM